MVEYGDYTPITVRGETQPTTPIDRENALRQAETERPSRLAMKRGGSYSPHYRRTPMAEVKTPPLIAADENGEPTYTFTSSHTFADVARWIVSEGGADDVSYLLQQMTTKENPDG